MAPTSGGVYEAYTELATLYGGVYEAYTRPVATCSGVDEAYARPVAADSGVDEVSVRLVAADHGVAEAYVRSVAADNGVDEAYVRSVVADSGVDEAYLRPASASGVFFPFGVFGSAGSIRPRSTSRSRRCPAMSSPGSVSSHFLQFLHSNLREVLRLLGIAAPPGGAYLESYATR